MCILSSARDRAGIYHEWLRDQARAGLLPHLKASRRVLFNVEAVEKALLDRARQSNGEASK